MSHTVLECEGTAVKIPDFQLVKRGKERKETLMKCQALRHTNWGHSKLR